MSPKNISIPNRKTLEKQYEALRFQYEKILNELQRKMKKILKQTAVNPTIKARVKPFESYYKKVLKRSQTRDQAFYIPDVLGMRIICPFLEDLKTVETLIRKKFQVVEIERKGANHSFKEFGYESTHFLIEVSPEILSQFQVATALVCEIQLSTILQDAWAEIEHELVYKAEFTPFDEPLKRKLAALNANLTLSDIIFQEIRDYQRQLRAQLKKRRETFFEKVQAATSKMSFDAMEGKFSGKKIQKTAVKKKDNKVSFHGDVKDNIDDLLLEALYAHNSKQFKMAIGIYTSILNLKPQRFIQSIIHTHRGMAYFAESNYDQALGDFSRGLELDQKNYKAFNYRGAVQSILQNYPEALEDFNRSLQLNPYQYYPLYNRAQIYFHLGDYSRSLADCEQALNIQPESDQVQKFRELVKSCIVR